MKKIEISFFVRKADDTKPKNLIMTILEFIIYFLVTLVKSFRIKHK